MYILKNAMKNLLRNKGRNIIIVLILLVTMTAVTICAILRQSADKQMEEYTNSFLPQITLSMDYKKISEDFQSRQITNIDGTSYLKSESIDVLPSDELCKKWRASSVVDHVDWTHIGDYCTTLKTLKNSSVVGEDSLEEYYGKDIEFFRNIAESDYKAKMNYYLSEEFKASKLYSKLFSDKHDVTEQEAKELAARTIFGDEDYSEYLERGISDALAGVAFDIKMGYNGSMEACLNMKQPTQGMICAYASYESPDTDFAAGTQTLETGNYPNKQNECMVSKQFAEINNLSIGDKIQITSGHRADGDAALSLRITGIFSCYYYEATHDEGSEILLNYIYTTEDTLVSSSFTNYAPAAPTFYLTGTDIVNDFKQMLQTDGLSEYMTVTDNIGELEALIQPVKKISYFSTILLVVILLLGGAVFLLLNFLAVCERKYEIGVLRSIGMKKGKVIQGFLYETVVIVLFCSIVGMTIGTAVSQPIANKIMAENANNIESDSGYETGVIDGREINGDQIIDYNGDQTITSGTDNVGQSAENTETFSMQTGLSFAAICEIMIAALLLMSAAVIIAGLYITKFEPMKILFNQE